MVAQIFRLQNKNSSSDEAKVSTSLVRVKWFLIFSFSIAACGIQGNDTADLRQRGRVVRSGVNPEVAGSCPALFT